MKKVFYVGHGTPEMYAIIRNMVPRGYELVTLEQNSDQERLEKVAECQVIIVSAAGLRKPLIDAATKLELVHHQGVGWQDTVDSDALKARGVPLIITPEGTTIGVAEHAVLLMLAVLKLLPFADSELRKGRFHINALRPYSRQIADLTVGYLGMGRIAQAVARRLAAFGCKGLFFDPLVEAAPDAERVSFEMLLKESDILTLHVPLTSRTRHVIGRPELAAMKTGAYIVNTARGGLVDEEALIDQLQSGHLAGAALDVFESEPLPSDSPLIKLSNTVLTPHIAAGTRDALAAKMRVIFANIERFYRGEALTNRVF